MCRLQALPAQLQRIVPFCESHVPVFAEWFGSLPGNQQWTPAQVRRCTIEDPTYDPGLMCAVEEQGKPIGFVIGNIAEGKGWVRAFVVHPERRHGGIGTTMFRHLEQCLVRRGVSEVQVGWSRPRYLLPGIDLRYTDALVFLDRLGYCTDRKTRVNMEVVLADREFATAAAEATLLERGVVVRRACLGDGDALVALSEEQGYPAWGAESAVALQREPPTLFVAEESGVVRAFAAYGVGLPSHFGPMLTAARLRGLGLGSVLLKRCLQDWQRIGLDRCEIIWAGPLSFYARSVGATMGRAFWTFQKQLA